MAEGARYASKEDWHEAAKAYRAAIALRRAHPALHHGAQDDMQVSGDVLSFTRREGGEEILWEQKKSGL